MDNVREPVGNLFRQWRQRRGMTQLHLSADAEVSTRHLSFIETGRSRPTREMILHLAEFLQIPLRDRNGLLLAAGYAPMYRERPLDAPMLAAARKAVDLVLAAHEPFPCLALDREWTLVAANRAVAPLLEGVSDALLAPPVNVLRLSLHPEGLAPRIANFGEWRTHLLARLRRQVDLTADSVLAELLRELVDYPHPALENVNLPPDELSTIIVPLRLNTTMGPLAFISTTTLFGTPVDITLSELALETFLPADARTADVLTQIHLSTGP